MIVLSAFYLLLRQGGSHKWKLPWFEYMAKDEYCGARKVLELLLYTEYATSHHSEQLVPAFNQLQVICTIGYGCLCRNELQRNWLELMFHLS